MTVDTLEHLKLSRFRQNLAAERRLMVLTAADSEALPTTKFLSRLADLDGAIAAVEAVLEENGRLRAANENDAVLSLAFSG